MADLVKSVLGGAWSLIIGWILPTYISLQLIAAFMLPGMREFQPIGQFYKFSSPTRQFALLAAAAVAGLVLAAAQAPLYRILEGYLLWPASISNRRIKRHQERHRELTDAQAVAAKANKGVRSGLLFERAARYPVQERQFAPTALGNAIRRFETYARDRYMLDSQLLWHHLTAAAPDRAVAAVDNARANVDFFVCLLYGSSAMAILGIAVVASGHASVQSSVATAAGIVIAIGCYRLALNATGFRAKGQGTSTSFDYVELFPVVDGLLCRFRAGRARLLLEEGLLGHSSSQEPLVSSYPAGPRSVSSIAGDGEVPGGGSLMVAVRLGDLVSPLRNGRPLLEGDRSALVIGGTGKIRGGEAVVFLKVVAVAPAQVRRDGRVQAQGSPCGHATLGPLEEWLEEKAGPGVIGQVAERAVLRPEFVKGERERLLARAFMIRVLVLMTLLPDAGIRDVIIALAGDLAGVPWARPWAAASERACGDWRNALGPVPLEELRDIVLRASWAEHQDRDWRAVNIGRKRPLKAGSIDGTLIRVPDTPANRAAFGSVGTGDDPAPFPQVRALPLNDVSTRALLGMPHGPAGTDKAAAGQKLLDAAMREHPHLFTQDRLWLMDRNYHGAARIARLIARTHVLIRLKGDIPLKQVSEILPDGSYLAELSGDGVTVTVRVIEYDVTVEGQQVPEMFCLVTDLLDWREYPALALAGLYKRRWQGSETALRESKASLDGAGPGTGPMLRSGSPDLVRQELAAWAAATEMTRGVARDAALAAIPAKKGRRAGQPVRPREISHARARRAILTAIRTGKTSYTTVTSAIGKYRTVTDRDRHRARKAKSPSTFGHATLKDTITRIAPAVITMANNPS